MIKIWLLGLVLIFTKHDFHTSLTEMNYNPKTKALELSIRMFSDDLELALTKFSGSKVNLEKQENNVLIEKYLRKNLALISENKEVKLIDLIGIEKEGDATWAFVEIPDCQNLKNHILFNSIFTEVFSDQTNLINIAYLGQKKTFSFSNSTKIENWPF